MGHYWVIKPPARARSSPQGLGNDERHVHEISKIPAELVIRHDYNPHTKQWTSYQTIVKMQGKPFAHGAMRHCLNALNAEAVENRPTF